MKRILLLLLLAGCGPDIIDKQVVDVGKTYEDRVSCTYTGYCYSCLPGFDGKMDCNFKLSPYCPGTANATLQSVTVEYYYSDGTRKTKTHTQIIEQDFCI